MRRERNALWPRAGQWDPMGELDRIRREIDDVFAPDRFFRGDQLERGLFDREFSPALDVVENEDTYEITVDLPGVDQKELDITVANNVMTIKGEKKDTREHKESKIYRKETWEGSFQRTLSLPAGVNPDGIDASMKNGVLHVVLPKREEAKPRQITVNVK
jgi:HSP20 family protein